MNRFLKIIFLFVLALLVAYQNSQTVRAYLDPYVKPVFTPTNEAVKKLI
jgi:hypothetical protein